MILKRRGFMACVAAAFAGVWAGSRLAPAVSDPLEQCIEFGDVPPWGGAPACIVASADLANEIDGERYRRMLQCFVPFGAYDGTFTTRERATQIATERMLRVMRGPAPSGVRGPMVWRHPRERERIKGVAGSLDVDRRVLPG